MTVCVCVRALKCASSFCVVLRRIPEPLLRIETGSCSASGQTRHSRAHMSHRRTAWICGATDFLSVTQQAVSCPPPTVHLRGLALVNGICHLFFSQTDEAWCRSLLWKLISPHRSVRWSFIRVQKGLESDPHARRGPHLSASHQKYDNEIEPGLEGDQHFPAARAGRAERGRAGRSRAAQRLISARSVAERFRTKSRFKGRGMK